MAVIDGILHPELEFISSRKYRNGHLWEVRKKRLPQPCRHCGLFSVRRYGRVNVTIRERSPDENPLWLKVHKHRYYCEVCRKPFTEITPGTQLRRRSTQRFRKFIKKCCQRFTTLKSVGYDNFCSQGFVYQAHYEQLEIKTRELRNKRWPQVMGIDEHFFTRRRGFPEYVTVFTDLKKRKLFEVAPTKSKKYLIEQLKDVPGRESVKIVCIDLAPGYRSLVKELFPNARIVADKFHVLKLLMNEIMKERMNIEEHHKKVLRRKRLLANRKNLDYWVKSEMNAALKHYPKLDELYRAKENLHTLYRSKGFLRAYQCYRKLITRLEKSTVPKLKTLLNTLKKWRDEILNYFDFKVTNAVTEAINGNAKALQKRARGYKQFKNYRLALLNACAF
jgi:transposase